MPRLPIRAAALMALACAAFAPLPAAAQQPTTPEQKAAIEQIVREYLIRNPEVIVEAMQALELREQKARLEAQRLGLVEHRKEIFEDPEAPVLGNPQGDVTLVEFFDYQCGYCKSVFPDLQRLIKADGKVKVVLKELPILGPASVTAAKASLAARLQGKYVPFHVALMELRGQLDDAKIFRAAEAVGLDVERLKRDMEEPTIAAHLTRNIQLADALQINGTPAFIAGDRLIPGAVPLDRLLELVRAQRAG
ncbi:DsbA family protein [Arenibaculum pallidiluteum]|uniref:DsbA family protein n=1 Tax=Arenibaculum pallidiluteum TaxID=2812559 RepID=UPI001A9785E1|nr:DsbA family protein [Arenibaculum pallidiluteum]